MLQTNPKRVGLFFVLSRWGCFATQLSENDTEAIANEFKKIAEAIESINLSNVMTKTK